MSTPPNPPSTPSGPPTEPAGTPVPEAASIPAPAQPLSLEKSPAPEVTPEAAPETAPATAPAPEDAVPAEAPAPAAEAPSTAPAPGSFAPVTPAPPAAPSTPAYGGPYAAPAPGNPWATPVGGFQAPPGGGFQAPHGVGFPPPPPPAASNGLAVAALLLGLFGILVALIPFFFWAGALLALTGVGLGIAAVVKARRGAPRATMAAFGVALSLLGLGASVGGWFITAAVIDKIDQKVAEERRYGDYEWDEEPSSPSSPYDPGTPSKPAKPSPSDVPGRTSALAWGAPYTYDDGVQVTVQKAVPYTPSSTAYPPEARNAHAVKVTVKIVNNSTGALDVSLSLPHARDDKGTEAEMAFDGSVPKMFKGSILAGESMTGTFAFVVPEDTKSLHFEIAPGTDYEDAIWSGPIG